MRRSVSLILALSALLVAVPAASANPLEDLLRDYVKDGQINPCSYSVAELKKIRSLVPADIDQYTPDFKDTLDSAIARRAQGGCDGGGSSPPTGPGVGATPSAGGGAGGSGGAPSAQAAPTAQPQAQAPVAPPTPQAQPTAAAEVATNAIPAAARTSAVDVGGSTAPFPLMALAILGGLLALGALLVGAARWWAFEPPWVQRTRHATAEAGWRASSTWAEFSDFVRLGR